MAKMREALRAVARNKKRLCYSLHLLTPLMSRCHTTQVSAPKKQYKPPTLFFLHGLMFR